MSQENFRLTEKTIGTQGYFAYLTFSVKKLLQSLPPIPSYELYL